MSKITSPQKLPRNVIALGFVSLFNDIASEMVYPLIPIFLTTFLGAPASVVGLVEGIAEATASILKGLSGWISDRLKRRKVFVVAGYGLSAFSKVVLSFAGTWHFVLFARFIDRFGKGTRTSARDALIADSIDEKRRGAAFGLHRGMDTAGAVIGPACGLLLLYVLPNQYSKIFLIASIPAFLGVLILILLVHEPGKKDTIAPSKQPAPGKIVPILKSARFRMFLLPSALFALGNSSDAFLILRSQTLGYHSTETVMLYILFNASYALLSYPFGKLSDRMGARKVLLLSFLLFSGVYLGFGLIQNRAGLWPLFLSYGVFMAMSDGVGKGYISRVVPQESKGTAFGIFSMVTGVMMLLASVTAGILWSRMGPSWPFYFGALLSFGAFIWFLAAPRETEGTFQNAALRK